MSAEALKILDPVDVLAQDQIGSLVADFFDCRSRALPVHGIGVRFKNPFLPEDERQLLTQSLRTGNFPGPLDFSAVGGPIGYEAITSLALSLLVLSKHSDLSDKQGLSLTQAVQTEIPEHFFSFTDRSMGLFMRADNLKDGHPMPSLPSFHDMLPSLMGDYAWSQVDPGAKWMYWQDKNHPFIEQYVAGHDTLLIRVPCHIILDTDQLNALVGNNDLLRDLVKGEGQSVRQNIDIPSYLLAYYNYIVERCILKIAMKNLQVSLDELRTKYLGQVLGSLSGMIQDLASTTNILTVAVGLPRQI